MAKTITLDERAEEALARYAAVHAAAPMNASEKDVLKWREECRSNAVDFAMAVLLNNPQPNDYAGAILADDEAGMMLDDEYINLDGADDDLIIQPPADFAANGFG